MWLEDAEILYQVLKFCKHFPCCKLLDYYIRLARSHLKNFDKSPPVKKKIQFANYISKYTVEGVKFSTGVDKQDKQYFGRLLAAHKF